MKKKLIIWVIICRLWRTGLVTAFIFVRRSSRAEISHNLSSRGADYIKQKAKIDGSSWKYVDVEKKAEAKTNERVWAGDCYSFVVPFTVWDIKPSENCSVEVSTKDPRTRIVTFRQVGSLDSIGSVDGVSFRKNRPELYSERTEIINGKSFLIFTTKQSPIEHNAFYLDSNFYIVLSLLGQSNEEYRRSLKV